jgi:hypothetical protein
MHSALLNDEATCYKSPRRLKDLGIRGIIVVKWQEVEPRF